MTKLTDLAALTTIDDTDLFYIVDLTDNTSKKFVRQYLFDQNLTPTSSPTFTIATFSSMTLGSVLFAGTAGIVTQDNANLFFDNTNNRFGVSTTAPISVATFAGDFSSIDGTGTTTVSGQLSLAGATTSLKRLTLGFDTTNNWGIIQAYWQGNSARSLILNPTGGSLVFGKATSVSYDFVIYSNAAANDFQLLTSTSSYNLLAVTHSVADPTLTIGGASSAANTISLVTTITGTNAINFNDGSNTGYISYDHATNYLAIIAGSRVGINTTSPVATLEVNGAAQIDGILTIVNADSRCLIKDSDTAFGLTGVQANIDFLDSTDTYGATIGYNNVVGDISDVLLIWQRRNAAINFYTNNVIVGVFDRSGNFGIKTEAPVATLEVNGTAQIDGILTIVKADSRCLVKDSSKTFAGALGVQANIDFLDSTDTYGATIGYNNLVYSGADVLLIQQRRNAPIYFYTNSSYIAQFDTQGRLGVGPTAPAYKLHVETAAADFAVYIKNTGNSYTRKGLNIQSGSNDNSSIALQFTSNDASYNLMFTPYQNSIFIDSGGATNFTVRGAANNSAALAVIGNSNGQYSGMLNIQNAYVHVSQRGAGLTITTIDGDDGGGAYRNWAVGFTYNSGKSLNFCYSIVGADISALNNTPALSLGNAGASIINGSLSVLAVAPNFYALDLVGTWAGAQIKLSDTTSDVSNKTAGITCRQRTNANAEFVMVRATSTSTANTLQLGGGSSSFNAATQIDFYTAANQTTVTGSLRMIILSSGLIGMGISTPAYPLDIVGTTNGMQIQLGDTASDVSNKVAGIVCRQRTNANAPFPLVRATSTSTANTLQLGGGSSSFNAATQIDFYTAANQTTVTGTLRVTILSDGDVGIGITTPTSPLHVIGTQGNGNQLTIATAISVNADKSSGIDGLHYNGSNFTQLLYAGFTSSATTIGIGGGTGLYSATQINLYTSSTNTTVTGSARLIINSLGVIRTQAQSHEHLQIGFDTDGAYNPYVGWYQNSTQIFFLQVSATKTLLFGTVGYIQITSQTSHVIIATNSIDRLIINSSGQFGYGGSSFASAVGYIMFIGNITTIASSNPIGGGLLYSAAGALKWKGSSGTVTSIAAA